MMDNNTSKTAAALALIGLLKVSSAGAIVENFTPIEKLPPEQRRLICEQLKTLVKDLHIDWDEIAVGVDEDGKITLVSKVSAGLKPTINPSCFMARVEIAEDCQ